MSNTKQISDLLVKASALRTRCPSIRRGQSMMIVLEDLRPDLGAVIAGTSADPFYKDNNIKHFLAVINHLMG